MTVAAPPPEPPRPDRRRALAGLGVVIAIAVGLAIVLARREPAPDLFTAKVQRGDIRDAVESTGTVNAVITVQVGSQVSGTIARLDADFNSRVKKDDILAIIDPRLFQGAVLQAGADLQNSQANVIGARANLAKAKAAEVQTRADFERASSLEKELVGTAQALDQAKASYEAAKAAVDAAQSSVTQADAQVSQKEAALAVAKTNLEFTTIRSPIDGVVVARNVDVGQTVAASLQAPTLFTIAQDLTKMRVFVKVDESDVGRIQGRQGVSFKVDAYPKETFHGAVTQVRMNPTSVQNVVTYDAVIDFDNPKEELYPGMTAYVTIPVAHVENVVEVPNAALRFKPPLSADEVRDAYSRAGIEPVKAGADASATAGEIGVIWKRLADQSLRPVKIALGITDHTFTEVRAVLVGALQEGDDVVTAAVAAKGAQPGGPRR
jgi:HlyD family secretion protein